MTTRHEFSTRLKNHDWYFAFSDDMYVYRRGRENLNRLYAMHEELDCDFPMDSLQKWANDMILEKFELREDHRGREGYFQIGQSSKNIAPLDREDLITQKIFDDIQAWMDWTFY